MNVHFDVPKEGKYWIVLGLCDPDTSNVKVSGKAVIMNPYGHIPARMYGIIPFTKWVLLIYTALFLAWIIRCCWYRKELMSVHVMITVVVGTFLFDTVIRLLMLSNFNHEGVYDRKITMFSLFITSATHTVARCLIIMVAMGLGVSKASLGNSMWKIVAMGVVYFFFSLWDSIVSTYSTDSKVNLYRIIPASLLDSFIYFWILQSLLDTIQELEETATALRGYRQALAARYAELSAMAYSLRLDLIRDRGWKGPVTYWLRLVRVYADGHEEREWSKDWPGNERHKALKAYREELKSRPGIETRCDIEKAAWEH